MTLSVWLGEFQLHDDGAVHYIVQQNLSLEKSCQPTTWSCLLTRDSPLLMSKPLVITYTVFDRGPCHLCAGLPVYPVLIMGDCSFQAFGPCHLCTGLPVYHVLIMGDYTVLGRWACHLCTGLPVCHVLIMGGYTVLGRWALPSLYGTARLSGMC